MPTSYCSFSPDGQHAFILIFIDSPGSDSAVTRAKACRYCRVRKL